MTDGDERRSAATVRLLMRDVTKRYGRLRALDRVSLAVHAGEIVAIVGENGAGKSTLVRCVVGDVDIVEGRVELLPSGPRGEFVGVWPFTSPLRSEITLSFGTVTPWLCRP
jgi:ABC-type branched-subunit amino acid transport system ATPase component